MDVGLGLLDIKACFVLLQGKPVGTPDPSSIYRVLQQHDVSAMFTAPTAMRAVRREVSRPRACSSTQPSVPSSSS